MFENKPMWDLIAGVIISAGSLWVNWRQGVTAPKRRPSKRKGPKPKPPVSP